MRAAGTEEAFFRVGQGAKKRKRVVSRLARACSKLLGLAAKQHAAEDPAESAAPVSLLEDDLPRLAWRQEVFVEAKLHEMPALSVGEARVRCSEAGCCHWQYGKVMPESNNQCSVAAMAADAGSICLLACMPLT